MAIGVSMFERILWGIGMMSVSVLAVIYARKIVEFLGSSATLEKYLGTGGTYMGLRIFAVFLFFFSILYMTGHVGTFFQAIGDALFRG
jgi:hypothetical protein